jgi:lipid-A-disaccharide synthase
MAEIARARGDRYQFLVPLAPTIDADMVRPLLGDLDLPILPGEMRPVMAHADAAVVASGTATLETALLATPMVVGYRIKTLTFWLARYLVDIPNIALVNIVLGKTIVPELIQYQFNAQRVVPILDRLIEPGEARSKMLAEFARLEEILGGHGASERAADVVKGFLLQ